jgi:hypothetical protein
MTSPLTKKQWEASVAEMWSASVKATCQDLIDEAVKAERERMTVVAMNAAEKAVDVAIKLEREACAKLLETTDLGGLKDNPAMQSWVAEMLLAYVKAIRARGQA